MLLTGEVGVAAALGDFPCELVLGTETGMSIGAEVTAERSAVVAVADPVAPVGVPTTGATVVQEPRPHSPISATPTASPRRIGPGRPKVRTGER